MLQIAEFTDKYQTMTRAHTRGAQDGNKNLPPSNESALTPIEREIIQLAQDDINKLAAKQTSEDDETFENVRALEADLPNGLLITIDSFKTSAELKLNSVERELLRLYENVIARKQDYRFFKTMNRLDREADVPSSTYVALTWLIFVMVLDGVVNAYFFKDSNANALLGGFLMAFFISLGNSLFGFVAGLVPWRYLQHRKRLHLIWSFPLLVFMLTAIGLFNLAVGHYRDLLVTDKDSDPSRAIDALYLLLLRFIRFQQFCWWLLE